MIERLTRDTPEDPDRIGGKGCGLVRLIRAGFPVPETWVLQCRPPPPVLPGQGCPEESLRQELKVFWDDFSQTRPGAGLAVRSSAAAEDMAQASFAGIYRTVLNVTGLDGLFDAVERCLGALFSEEAAAYLDRLGMGWIQPRIALVLQRMVRADVAGVLLTTNPLCPFAGEAVVNASYGLGESIVSGTTHPDEIVFDKASGAVLARKVGSKENEIRYVPGKGQLQRRVKKQLRDRLCLKDAQIRRLFELCREVEGRIGPDQDCEWAFEGDRLFVLQQRPITGLPPRDPHVVWSRKFGDEYLAEYNLPLGDTLLGGWIRKGFLDDFAQRLGFAERLTHAPTLLHKGYAYINGEYILNLLSALPSWMRRPDSLGWFTPLWEARIQAAPFRPLQLMRAARIWLSDPYASARRNPEALRRHAAALEKGIVPRLGQDYSLLTDSEWSRQYDEVMALGAYHFRIIRWGMGVYNPFFHGVVKLLLRKWCDEDAEGLYPALIAGLPGTRTTQINRAIWQLGEAARDHSPFRAAIVDRRPYESVRREFRNLSFWKEFDRFLDRYGHRSSSREISQPSWRESPEVVLGFVRAQLAGDRPVDPSRVEAETAGRRVQAEQKARRLAGRGVSGPVRKLLLWQAIQSMQRYTRYREDQRFYLDMILDHIRGLVLEMARRFTEQGILDTAEDVFFLDAQTFHRIRKGEFDRATVRATILEQRNHYELWKNRIPATYLFDGVETEGEVAEGPRRHRDEEGMPHRFTGTPASNGVADGTVRVIPSVGELDRIRPGEILVASNTDPGWTSVFPRLGGLVTETGGMLSHGALLAREYGIPAVTGIAGATRLLKTGQRIRLNGREGTVEILEGDPG